MYRMTITFSGDALKLLEDFIKYGELYPEDLADAMLYDLIGFKSRLRSLKIAVEHAAEQALAQ